MPIDVDRARDQHAAYERCLERAGCSVRHVQPAPDLPDSVFVEDIAIVFDEVAVIARPGAPSRRPEISGVARLLDAERPLQFIAPPATLDGGDVLVAGRTVFVGESTRTDAAAIDQLHTILHPFGYAVRPVRVTGCLHLKSAVTAIDDDRLLIDPSAVDRELFSGYELVEIDPSEPGAANVLRVGASLVYPDAYPRTRERLEHLGVPVMTVDVGEIAKAEGAVTCCSLIWRAR